jgi:glycosyltransferase involved in cell wall biosynthesis
LTLSQSGLKYGVELDKIGVVIPAYNAEKMIGTLVRELIAYGFKKENVIVVDDGSQDRTAEVAEHAGAEVLKNGQNMGKGFALRWGFERTEEKKLERVITLDADGQHQVKEISGFLETGCAYELVIGTRVIDQGRMPLLRKIVNRTTSLVISLLGHENVPDVQSGYRMIDLRIFKKIRLRTNNFQTEAELVCKAARSGYRIGFTPITAVYDDERSYIKPMIDTIRFINMALRFLWR